MMRENENLPEMERLEQQEFNLDAEEQRRLEAMVEQEVIQVSQKHTRTHARTHTHKHACIEAFVVLCGHDGRDS